jgi:hypothetical protein
MPAAGRAAWIEAFRLPVKSPKDLLPPSMHLISHELQHANRLVCLAGIQHWKPPHDSDRYERPFDGMVMHPKIRRRRAFDQEERSITAVSEPGHLWKEASVNQRSCKIGRRFTLNEHLVLNQVVAGREAGHLQIERTAPTERLQHRRAPFGMVDDDLTNRIRH